MKRIAVDAMGGDFAPHAVVDGAVLAARRLDVGVTLVGDAAQLERELARHLAQVHQERGDGVRHSRSLGAQYLVAFDVDALNLQLAFEFRGVAHFDFVKKDRVARRDVVVDAFFAFFETVFFDVAGLAAVRHDADLAFRHFIDNLFCPLVEFDLFYPQLGGAEGARDKRSQNDRKDKKRSDLYSVRALDDVCDGRV